jgi:chromosome segregation protein
VVSKRVIQETATREEQVKDKVAQLTLDVAAKDAEVKQLSKKLLQMGATSAKAVSEAAVRERQLKERVAELELGVSAKETEIQQLQERVSILGLDKIGLDKEAEGRQTEMEHLRATLSELTRKNKDLGESLAAKDQEIQVLQQAKSKASEETVRLEQKSQEMAAGRKTDLHRLETRILELTAEKEESSRQLWSKEKEAQLLLLRISLLKEEHIGLEKRMIEEKSTAEELEKQLSRARTEVQNLQGERTEREGKIQRLQEHVSGLDEERTRMENEIIERSSEVMRLKEKMAEAVAYERELIEELERKDKHLEAIARLNAAAMARWEARRGVERGQV